MIQSLFLVALLITSSQSAGAGSEDIKTIPDRQEITDLMLQASRMSSQEQISKVTQILKDQPGSKTPRSDFMFCTGLAYLGNYKAQTCVGYAYEKGLGIIEDLYQAYIWYELALSSRITDEAEAKRAEADRDRVKERLFSAYPHPTEDDLADLVNSQKARIVQYQGLVKKGTK
jgi:hypothetical protein